MRDLVGTYEIQQGVTLEVTQEGDDLLLCRANGYQMLAIREREPGGPWIVEHPGYTDPRVDDDFLGIKGELEGDGSRESWFGLHKSATSARDAICRALTDYYRDAPPPPA